MLHRHLGYDVHFSHISPGADSRANDGTYSAYFTQFQEDGDLDISVRIDNSQGGKAQVASPSFSKAFGLGLYEGKYRPVFIP